MELDEQVQPLVHDIEDEVASKPPSLSDSLRSRRKEIAETKEVLLPLIGYEEFNVAVKHRLIERSEVEAIGKKVIAETRDRAERNMRILLDTILNSTLGFYIQEDGGIAQPIINDLDGDRQVINWDEFARYLGWNPGGEGDARSAMYFVFGSNEFAIGQYGILLNRWMSNTGLNVDEELLGEGL
jgi:hypothetical protein